MSHSMGGFASAIHPSIQILHNRRPDLYRFTMSLCEEGRAVTQTDGDTDVMFSDEDEASAASDAENDPDDGIAGDPGSVSMEASSESDDSDQSASDSDDTARSDVAIHVLSVGIGDRWLNFPSDLFCHALRHTSLRDGEWHPGYAGPILLSTCHGGLLRNALKDHGGHYLVLNGTKPGWEEDGTDCMREAIEIMAEHKRQLGKQPTAYDYWARIRHISGEHIAWVGDGCFHVHKVLAHHEPVLGIPSDRAARQPVRVLRAKLMHGSDKAVQAVFDKYGSTAFADYSPSTCFGLLAADDDSPLEAIRHKLQVLDRHGIRVPDEVSMALPLLERVIAKENPHALMAVLLHRPQGKLPASLSLALLACVSEHSDRMTRVQLLRMCEHDRELGETVLDCLLAGLTGHPKTQRTLQLLDAPYFLEPLFKAALSRYPWSLGEAVWRHLNRVIARRAEAAALDKNNFLNDPAGCLENWITIYTVYRPDFDLATALVSAARAAELPIDPILKSLRRLGEAGRLDLLTFLRQPGIATNTE